MAKEFKVIGKKVERVDAFEVLTGEAKYASDIYPPGMLYVRILRRMQAYLNSQNDVQVINSQTLDI